MTEEKYKMFNNRLDKVRRHIGKLARRQQVTCFRLYDHDLPEFPFCIEIYGDYVYVAEYKRRHGMGESEHQIWVNRCLEIMAEALDTSKEKIFIKLRQRKAGRTGQYQKYDEVKSEIVVEENGLKFIVNLSDYLDTGLFLDHRATRQMMRTQCEGKRVLNLFAYTGSFSVYAAAGGASEVTTVDLSNTYIKWAERNMHLNAFTDPDKYKYVQADVLQYLGGIKKGTFDIIVMDPPTFSNSKRMDDFLDIQRDHVQLINWCIGGLSEGGVLYFSTNYKKFQLNKEQLQTSKIKDVTRATTPFDFEGRLYRYCYKMEK